MEKDKIKYLIIAVVVSLVTALASWIKNGEPPQVKHRDFDEIMASGEIKVIVEDNKMSYYTLQCDTLVECDSLKGLQVDMIKEFGKKHGLNITFFEQRDLNVAMDMLFGNKVDVLVWHIPVYDDMKQTIAYTIPVFTSRQKLIQRKHSKNDTTLFITNQLDLAEKDVFIVPGSVFKQRLDNLQREIGDTIYIHEMPGANDDLLFRLVSDTLIDYSVCDEFVARVLQKDYPAVDMSTAVSFTQNYSWGVSPDTPVLLD
ncbi:MAG: transporter substrate-binding domain-containing protein, partial [Paludibacteraceae bacterium]|nr:transporter substrate-binding domain-containing protein [Paludibacteraceae bacterium]